MLAIFIVYFYGVCKLTVPCETGNALGLDYYVIYMLLTPTFRKGYCCVHIFNILFLHLFYVTARLNNRIFLHGNTGTFPEKLPDRYDAQTVKLENQ